MERAFPKWFMVLGWIFYPIAALLVLRLLWEKTFLAWTRGEHVGFSIVHDYPIPFFVGVFGMVLCDIWLVVGTVYLIRRRAVVSRSDKIQYAVIVLTMLVDLIPSGFWVNFVRSFANG